MPLLGNNRERCIEYEYKYCGAEYERWITVGTALCVGKSAAEAYIVEAWIVPRSLSGNA